MLHRHSLSLSLSFYLSFLSSFSLLLTIFHLTHSSSGCPCLTCFPCLVADVTAHIGLPPSKFTHPQLASELLPDKIISQKQKSPKMHSTSLKVKSPLSKTQSVAFNDADNMLQRVITPVLWPKRTAKLGGSLSSRDFSQCSETNQHQALYESTSGITHARNFSHLSEPDIKDSNLSQENLGMNNNHMHISDSHSKKSSIKNNSRMAREFLSVPSIASCLLSSLTSQPPADMSSYPKTVAFIDCSRREQSATEALLNHLSHSALSTPPSRPSSTGLQDVNAYSNNAYIL